MTDPDRLGGVGWARRTGGALTGRERRRLLGEIVRGQAQYLTSRLRLATGRAPSAIGDLDLSPPDSVFARLAEEACREQPAGLMGHAYRTWIYGAALAAVDRRPVDREQLYVAGLLHDHGLIEIVADQDFTIRSGDRAIRCADEAGSPHGEAIADGICAHATPGATVERDGALGFYIQGGALVDLVGIRADAIPESVRRDAVAQHPFGGVVAEVGALIRAEAAANPRSRFALLHRCGFIQLMKIAPRTPGG